MYQNEANTQKSENKCIEWWWKKKSKKKTRKERERVWRGREIGVGRSEKAKRKIGSI